MTTTHLISADELWQMPNDQRRELVKGEIRIMAPTGFDHGVVTARLTYLLARHIYERNLGVLLGAETGFRLSPDPDTVRAADVAFVRADRVPTERPTKYWQGAPDLAVEVVSPGDTHEEVEEKVADYLAAGTRSVWVVNPKRRSITLHRPGQNPVVLRDTDTLTDPDVLPGLSFSVAEAFA